MLEFVRGHCKPEERDEAIGGGGWYASRGRERCEGGRGRQNRAKEHRAEDEHDRDGVARLALLVDLSDPPREGEHAVTSNREDEPRGSYDGHAGVLDTMSVGVCVSWGEEGDAQV